MGGGVGLRPAQADPPGAERGSGAQVGMGGPLPFVRGVARRFALSQKLECLQRLCASSALGTGRAAGSTPATQVRCPVPVQH